MYYYENWFFDSFFKKFQYYSDTILNDPFSLLLLLMKKFLITGIALAAIIWATYAMTPNFVSEVLPWMNTNGLTKFSKSADFRPNDSITRWEASKFVASFWQLKKLAKKWGSCAFSDTNGYDSTLTPSIQQACELGLLKWSNGKFMPNSSLTEAQALAIVIRSLDGFLDETVTPWYKNYFTKAQSYGMISTETLQSVNGKNVTRGKLGTWFYQANTPKMVKDDMKKDEIMKQPGAYQAYSESAVKTALADGKKVALFFHASRCPACVNAEKEIMASTLPDNSVIFKVNYDTETDLKKTYGVTSQHTFVFLDSSMQSTAKKLWLSTNDLISMLK